MTDITAEYIAELNREIEMRGKVYPGRVKAGKMTQATADKKTELIRNVAALFKGAAEHGVPVIEIRLPVFHLLPGASFPITTLEPHIKEIMTEIQYRCDRIERLPIPSATREHALYQLRLFREILEILRHIQGEHVKKTTQTTLF